MYFSVQYGRPLKNGDLDAYAKRYFNEKRNYQADVERFFAFANKKYVPGKIKVFLSHIRQFLLRNDVELKRLFWQDLARKAKGSRARTVAEIPTPTLLRRILQHASIQVRAVIFTLASSGMRIR